MENAANSLRMSEPRKQGDNSATEYWALMDSSVGSIMVSFVDA